MGDGRCRLGIAQSSLAIAATDVDGVCETEVRAPTQHGYQAD